MEQVVLTSSNPMVEVVTENGKFFVTDDARIVKDYFYSDRDEYSQNFDKASIRNVNEISNRDKLYTYLLLLFESQKSGHDVHNEISQALESYRNEVGL